MDNQHRLISGYRELNQEEILMMNEIKRLEALVLAKVEEVKNYGLKQAAESYSADKGTISERIRIEKAEPGRWTSIAKTELQNGFMALIRAVAQPLPMELPE